MPLFGGEDDDCDRPACDDIKKQLPSSKEELDAMIARQQKATNNKKKKKKKAKETIVESYDEENKLVNMNMNIECPPRSAELGRSSWTLLHSMAAWYPDEPTKQQRQTMNNFFVGLAQFYPCSWCAIDFQENIQKTPVATESRTDLCMWLCDQHNRVNKKLGKPIFDCNMKNLDERWRKSSNDKCQS